MKSFEVSQEDAQILREKVLRKPDINMEIFAKRLREPGNSSSLPLSFEMMMMDFTADEIVKELIQFYCENATRHLEILNNSQEKRKYDDGSVPVKITKDEIQKRITRSKKS
jgi:hypothetical protein